VTRPDLVDSETLTLMKNAGCELILYGVESGSQLILDNLNKNISISIIRKGISLTKKSGIKCIGSFIIGAPGDNKTTINKTISFARKYMDMASFSALLIFSKTTLANLTKKESGRKLFDKWDSFSFRDIPKIIYIPKGFNYRLLKYFICKAYIVFYINPKIIRNFLHKIFSSWKVLFYMKHIFLTLKSLTVTLTCKNK